MAKLKVYTDGLEGFEARTMSHARALDRGDSLPAHNSVTFSSMHEMLHVLTPKRLTLLETLATNGSRPVNLLAKDVRRKRDAVLRDINVLRKIGVVSTGYDETRVFTAKPLATRFEFVCSIDSRESRHRKASSLAS